MWKFIIGFIFGIIVSLLILISIQPESFRITRSTTIVAPAELVFNQVNNLHLWNDWSPWAKLDPNAKDSFEGPLTGNGAKMAWAGNSEVGEGSMTIVESHPNEKIQLRLDFVKPMQATNTVEFLFVTSGNQTWVTWTMYGKRNFIGKAMGLVMDCEKMIGEQYEKGLTNLKGVVESKVAPIQ